MSKMLEISNTEDGEVYARVVTVKVLQAELDAHPDDFDEDSFFSAKAFTADSWDFANTGPRGRLLVPLDAIVTPKPEKRATAWRIK